MGRDLSGVLSGQVRIDPLSLALYSTDASIYQITPLCVVLPRDEQDIVKVVTYAAAEGISVIARGGGSGLAGESVGEGIILDMSRFMNRIHKIDLEANEAVVESGVILDELNRRLAPYGRQIGPDPSSGNRATVGGVIGNNATGAHSLKYGYISRHVRRVRAVSADGQLVELADHSPGANGGGLVGNWIDSIYTLIHSNRELLERVRPRTERNRSGYDVFSILQEGRVHLGRLLAGSEGTLAIVSQAAIGLVARPKVKMLLQLNFATLDTMALALPEILRTEPAACELMDGKSLRLAREAYPEYADVLPDDIDASLLVEYSGPDEAAVLKQLQQARRMAEQLPATARCQGVKEITSPKVQARMWAARKAAVPLLFRGKGPVQPIPVIEDAAVNPEQLGQYLRGLQEISVRMGLPMVYYGHAGSGELHIRPFLNLHRPEEVRKMRRLAEETFKLVWSLGGTISGEHGEGLVRVSFIRQQYGQEVYDLFRQVKNIFDPRGLLNPGKIINDDPDVMEKNLRFAQSAVRENRPRNLVYRDGEFLAEIENCNGNGLCRSSDPLISMCPIFRATGDEDASPRAKGNLMRHWLYGLLDENIMQTEEFKRVADLCVNCKMCALQCPSLVNVPKLMMEARAEYVRHKGLTRPQFVLTRSEWMSRFGSSLAPLANLFLSLGWFRKVLERASGLDHRRPMPAFDFGSNVKKLQRYLRWQAPLIKPIDKVAYFVDLYAAYNDHELGKAVVDVLRHNQVEVIVPPQVGVGMPAISYGDLPYARRAMDYNIRHLAEAVRRGYKVICSEPTAALCLQQEYLDIAEGPEYHLVAENTWELTGFLADLAKQGRLNTSLTPQKMKLAYHKPCHYEALKIGDATLYLMRMIEGVEIETLPNSCCGIAGTFGFQKKNFDLSMQAGQPMLEPLRASTADFGLTECSTCKMQMELAAGKKVLHPVKILSQAYGLSD